MRKRTVFQFNFFIYQLDVGASLPQDHQLKEWLSPFSTVLLRKWNKDTKRRSF